MSVIAMRNALRQAGIAVADVPKAFLRQLSARAVAFSLLSAPIMLASCGPPAENKPVPANSGSGNILGTKLVKLEKNKPVSFSSNFKEDSLVVDMIFVNFMSNSDNEKLAVVQQKITSGGKSKPILRATFENNTFLFGGMTFVIIDSGAFVRIDGGWTATQYPAISSSE